MEKGIKFLMLSANTVRKFWEDASDAAKAFADAVKLAAFLLAS